MCGSRGGTDGPDPPPPEKSQKYRFSYQYWPGSPEKHKATKQAFNVWPTSARQRNANSMAFRWRVDEGPLIMVLGFSLPSTTKKKNVVKNGPPL